MMAELQGTPCRSTSCDHNKVLFVNKYLLSPCATSQHFKSLDQRFQHTLAWRTDTMENVCGSVPSPPYWWSTDQCHWRWLKPWISAVWLRAPVFPIIRAFVYCNGPDESCCCKQSGAVLLNTTERAAELHEELKVSTYVCKKGTALCRQREVPHIKHL